MATDLYSRVRRRHATRNAARTIKSKFEERPRIRNAGVAGTSLVSIDGQLYPADVNAAEGTTIQVRNIGRPGVAKYAPISGGSVIVSSVRSGGGSTPAGGFDASEVLYRDGRFSVTENLPVEEDVQIGGVNLVGYSDGIALNASNGYKIDLAATAGLEISGDKLRLGLPATLSASTTNTRGTQSHAHAITATDDGAGNHGSLLQASGTGGLTLDYLTAPLLQTAAGNLTITPAGRVDLTAGKEIRTTDSVTGFLGTGWRLTNVSGASLLDIRKINVEELHAYAFTADFERVRIGETFTTTSMGILAADLTTPAVSSTTTLTVEDVPQLTGAIFTNNDWVMLSAIDRSAGLSIIRVWGQVSGYSDNGDGTQDWTYTHRSGTVGALIKVGSLAVDFGASGAGYIHASVIDDAGSPYTRYGTWETNPYTPSNRTVQVQIGNLDSVTDTALDPSGYGIYGQNAFLSGSIVSAGGDVRIYENDGINIQAGSTEVRSTTLSIDWWNDITDRTGTPRLSIYAGESVPPVPEYSFGIFHLDPGARAQTWMQIYAGGKGTGSNARIDMYGGTNPAGESRIVITASRIQLPPINAHLTVHADNTYDIGATDMRIRKIYADQIEAGTLTYSEAITGDEWEGAGNMVIDAHAASATTVYVRNDEAGYEASLDVEGDVNVGGNITVSGTVDSVDIAAFKSSYDAHTHGTTGGVVGVTNTQTLTNKTLTNPVISTYLNFTDAQGDKALWYSNTYGTGVESATLTHWANSRHRFRIGGTSVSSGSEIVSITGTGIGIATGDPAYPLDVTGAGNFTGGLTLGDAITIAGSLGGGGLWLDSSSGAGIRIDRGTDTSHNRIRFQTAGVTYWDIGNKGAGNEKLHYYYNDSGTPSFTMDVTGRMGIGNAAPTTTLHITAGNSPRIRLSATDPTDDESVTAYIEYYRGDTTNRIGYFGFVSAATEDWIWNNQTAGGSLQMRTNNTNRVTITSAGLVGVGTTGPASPLHVWQNDTNTGAATGITVEQAGIGDAQLQLLAGAQRWVIGIDNSTSDQLRIGRGTNWSSSIDLYIGTGGKVYTGDDFQVGQNLNVIGTSDLAGDTDIDGNVTITATHWIELEETTGKVIDFDGGHSAISVHDGYGNFNLNSGVDPETYKTVDGAGGGRIEMNSSGTITITVTTAAYDTTFTDDTYIQINATNDDIPIKAGTVRPTSTVVTDLGRIDKKWKEIHGATLIVGELVAKQVLATIGGEILVSNTTKLTAQLDDTDTTIYMDYQLVSTAAFAMFMGQDVNGVYTTEIIKLNGSGSTDPLGWKYAGITRGAGGTTPADWPIGTALVSLGAGAGSGYISITSTQNPNSFYGPSIAIYRRTDDTAWNNVKGTVVLGNLRNLVDYGASDEHGIVIGNDVELTPSTGFSGITGDVTDGVRLFNADLEIYDGANLTTEFSSTGINLSSVTWAGGADVNAIDWYTGTGPFSGRTHVGGLIIYEDPTTDMVRGSLGVYEPDNDGARMSINATMQSIHTASITLEVETDQDTWIKYEADDHYIVADTGNTNVGINTDAPSSNGVLTIDGGFNVLYPSGSTRTWFNYQDNGINYISFDSSQHTTFREWTGSAHENRVVIESTFTRVYTDLDVDDNVTIGGDLEVTTGNVDIVAGDVDIGGQLEITGRTIHRNSATDFYSTETGKTDWRLTINTADAEIVRLFNIDSGLSAYHKIRIGGDTSANVGLTVDGAGNVGIGTDDPVDLLHVKAGSYGGTPHSYTSFLVEDDTYAAITIATPNNRIGYIWFADPDANTVGALAYDHTNERMFARAGGGVRYYLYNDRLTLTNTYLDTNGNKITMGDAPIDELYSVQLENTEKGNHTEESGRLYFDENISSADPAGSVKSGNTRGGLMLYNPGEGWCNVVDTGNMDEIKAKFYSLETTTSLTVGSDLTVTGQVVSWTDIPYSAYYDHYNSSTHCPGRYGKLGNLVFVMGYVKMDTVESYLIGTLPTGYRPVGGNKEAGGYAINQDDARYRVYIQPDGDIYLENTPGYTDLNEAIWLYAVFPTD